MQNQARSRGGARPGTGGRREGAGRKAQGKAPLRGTITVKIPAETAALYKSLPMDRRQAVLDCMRRSAESAIAAALNT